MKQQSARKQEIPDKVYFRIGEVSTLVGVDPHVLRFWEAEFSVIKPRRAKSNQRLYRRKDVENLILIKSLLHGEGYTISGARKLLRKGPDTLPGKVSDAAERKRKKVAKKPQKTLSEIKKELRIIQQLMATKSLRY